MFKTIITQIHDYRRKNSTILVVKIYLDSYCNNNEQRKERAN